MSAALRLARHPVELSQVEAEAAALSNYYAAIGRKDTDEARRLWQVYARIHAQRPPQMVERMERERGLC